ncbi:MAG TPA: hypothetical protein VKI44_06665 [Acetobacteraceae bacterium]|nr:hypothetical protein [Acetobacteraceae bacterium]
MPVHLCRGPVEPIEQECAAFYGALLRVLKETSAFRDGAWSQIDPEAAWPGNWTADDFIAFAWTNDTGNHHVVVVNYAANQGQCRLKLPFPELRDTPVQLVDALGTERYLRDGSNLVDNGLYVDHSAWHFNVFELQAV